MSRSLNSPTGKLLRSSRLFALPPSLPTPVIGQTAYNKIPKYSDTATLPYPTHQAIAASKASRSRGDWGLKRPLPSKAARASTPYVRIHALDNYAHVTDYASAADHTQTLAKFQEMNVVMRRKADRDRITTAHGGGLVSVFDEESDNTARADINLSLHERVSATTRWKVQGPWLAGMSEDDFQRFLNGKLRSGRDRAGFMAFVARHRSSQKRAEVLRRLREDDNFDPDHPDTTARVEAAATVSPEELDVFIKQLRREDTSVTSELASLIQDYYDMPATSREYASDTTTLLASRLSTTSSAPPPVHASAGLSYLRSSAWMTNHPNYGPQAHQALVQARVVRPRVQGSEATDRALLGVGGLVAVDSVRSPTIIHRNSDTPDALTARQNYEITGGSKIWVHAQEAYIDEQGSVRLRVARGAKEAIEVRTGEFDPTRPVPAGDKKFVNLFGANGGPEGAWAHQGLNAEEVDRLARGMRPSSAADREGLEQFKNMS